MANIHAQTAMRAIQEVRHAEYEGMMTDQEREMLSAAIEVLENIQSRTTVRDAMEHFDNAQG